MHTNMNLFVLGCINSLTVGWEQKTPHAANPFLAWIAFTLRCSWKRFYYIVRDFLAFSLNSGNLTNYFWLNFYTFTLKCWIAEKKFPKLLDTIFSIYIVYQCPHENILKKSVWSREKIEVKVGSLVKKLEFI